MIYLVIQTSFILLVTAALFFALGSGFMYFLNRRNRDRDALPNLASDDDVEKFTASVITEIPDAPKTSKVSRDPLADEVDEILEPLNAAPIAVGAEADAAELEALRAAVNHLQDQLVQKERMLDELSRSMPAAPAETSPSDGHLMSKIPQMEAALETQGALLESKSLALEKAKNQIDRERERASLLEQKLLLLEAEMNELRNHQAQSLWQDGQAAPAAASDTSAKDTEITMLRAERDGLREELSQLQANVETMREESSERDANSGAMNLWREKAEAHEKDLAERRRVEQSLRDEIDSLRNQIERQNTGSTQVVDPKILERLARAEAIASERRQEAREREQEIERRYAERIRDLEATVDSFTWEKEALAQAQGQVKTLESALDTVQSEREELARSANRVRELERALESLEAEKHGLERFSRRVEELELELDTSRSAKEDIEQQLDKAKQEILDLEEQTARLPELERTLGKLRWEMQSQAEEAVRVTELERQVEQLKEEVRAGERHALRVGELERALSEARAQLPQVENLQRDAGRVRELEERIAKLLGEKQKAEVAIAHLSLLPARLEKMQRELNDHHEAATQAVQRARELEKQLAEQRRGNEQDVERVLEHAEKMEELENTVQWLKQENEFAWTEGQNPEPSAPVSPAVNEFQRTQAEFQRLLSEFPSELNRQENARVERAQRDDAGLAAIQRKLEQIESEVLGMERLLKRDLGETELVAAVWRVEKMLNERLSGEDTRALHHQLESMQALMEEREKLIATLRKQLQDLSHKVSPELVGEDNLQLIHGVGPYTKKVLREEFGITTFRQLARLTSTEIQRISDRLFFKGRIQREDWLGQAVALHFKKYNELVENPDPPYPMKWAG